MHGSLRIYVLICIEILAITAVLHFLVKAMKENMGGLVKWAAYILLLVGFLIMICTLTRGLMTMTHHNKDGMESCGWHGGHGCMMMMHGNCCGECEEGKCDDGKCEGKEEKECCEKDSMKMHHHMDMKDKDGMMKKDSAKGK